MGDLRSVPLARLNTWNISPPFPRCPESVRDKLLSSRTFRRKRTFDVIRLVAQAADNSRPSPSCFLDLIVQVAVFALIRFPSMMKPEP